MPNISRHAVVQSEAIGDGSQIDEFAIIRSGAIIGRNVRIHSHAVIESGVTLHDDVEVFHGAYVGRIPKGAGATSRRIEFEPRITIGPRCSIGPHSVIYYDAVIGENTLIADHASIREKTRIGSRCIVSRGVTINYNATVGDRSKIMDLVHITGNCVIGTDVFISVGVMTVNDNSIGRLQYDSGRVVGPRIENEAAIGANATLLPGVRIGTAAIVAAGAVVTRDVAPNTKVRGVPATPF